MSRGNEAPPTVSVIIPTYNRAEVVGRAINSVLAQTFDDWELIVIDDASTDNTEEVVSSFTDTRIRYHRHQTNRGGSAARNTGIRKARGQYIAFLDSDDEWLPKKIEMQVDKFRAVGRGAEMVYTNLINKYQEYEEVRGKLEYGGNISRKLLIKNVIGTTSTAMVQKNILTCVGGFDDELPARQDLDLWVRISKKYEIKYIPKPLAIIHKERSDRISKDNLARCRGYLMFYKKHKISLLEAGLEPIYLKKMGKVFEINCGKKKFARKLYTKAIMNDMRLLGAYIGIFTSFLPDKLRKKLKDVFRKISKKV